MMMMMMMTTVEIYFCAVSRERTKEISLLSEYERSTQRVKFELCLEYLNPKF